MNVKICIGSTCHLLGSRRVVEKFQAMVAENHLEDKVRLVGGFCMQKCGQGICVSIDGETHVIQAAEAEDFFNREILAKV